MPCTISTHVAAQKKWDGNGNDGQWNNPLNWEDDLLPSVSDDVIIDNSLFPGNFIVSLPSGTATITIHSLQISAAPGNTITVEIPKSNIISPCLRLSALNYSMVINNGAIFKNSSGSSTGAPLVLADTLRINNGGRYIHNTSRAHAALVDMLSRSAGTEEGVFEFNVPGASSTISLSDREYGKLVLSSTAANNVVSYTAAGTRRIRVRSDLEINEGVRLNLNCSDTFLIERDLLQRGGVLNVSTLSRSLVMTVRRHLIQDEGASITESGSVFPILLFAGSIEQEISTKGLIQNQVSVIIDNLSGCVIQHPLSLPYSLKLLKGRIRTAEESLLTLSPNCTLIADSTNNTAFIDGPLRKEGLLNTQQFLFPVGEGRQIRWLELKNASGDFTVQYIKKNPRLISGLISGVNRISALEYWTIQTSQNNNELAEIELSFNDGNHSGVTDMGTLRVAQLSGGTWINAGNVATTGSPGASGSVVSNPVSEFPPGITFFTLASSVADQNPLPVKLINFSAKKTRGEVSFSWTLSNEMNDGYVELQSSEDNSHYISFMKMEKQGDRKQFNYVYKTEGAGHRYYRLKIVQPGNDTIFSKSIFIFNEQWNEPGINGVYPAITHGRINISISSAEKKKIILHVIDQQGRIVRSVNEVVSIGNNLIELDCTSLSRGMYFIGLQNFSKTKMYRFIKL